jgi:hypothetical protein
MRFIITAQASPNAGDSPAADPGNKELFAAYMRFNEELYKAGVLVASEGLTPAAPGARVELRGGKRTVVDGPFAESKELVGGFYILDVKSLDEAISWALRAPSGMGFDDVLEIRQLTGESDIPGEYLDIIKAVAPTWAAWFKDR